MAKRGSWAPAGPETARLTMVPSCHNTGNSELIPLGCCVFQHAAGLPDLRVTVRIGQKEIVKGGLT